MKTIWNIISIVTFGMLLFQVFFEHGEPKTVEPQAIEIEEPDLDCYIYITEEMPRFPGCENMGLSKAERQSCANKKLLQFVYSNIKYPSIENDSHIEGTAVVQFTIEKDGRLADIKILKGLSSDLGNEIVKLIKRMPRWIPGRQFEKEVAVRFTLPIKIKLE